jgi:hypothetical protein
MQSARTSRSHTPLTHHPLTSMFYHLPHLHVTVYSLSNNSMHARGGVVAHMRESNIRLPISVGMPPIRLLPCKSLHCTRAWSISNQHAPQMNRVQSQSFNSQMTTYDFYLPLVIVGTSDSAYSGVCLCSPDNGISEDLTQPHPHSPSTHIHVLPFAR